MVGTGTGRIAGNRRAKTPGKDGSEDMECRFWLTDSLEKIFFRKKGEPSEYTRGSMLKNEIFSFQLVGELNSAYSQRLFCRLELESPLTPYIKVYRVGYVPVLAPTIEIGEDEDYITKEPGLFPDPLFRVRDGRICLVNRQTRAFWISVEPAGEIAGLFPVILRVRSEEGELLTELEFTLEIIDRRLPEQKLLNTGWFHGDCIAAAHHVEIMSEEYFALVEKYLELYVKFGHNTILTPLFTPPLDTVVGEERPTNQLVDVVLEKGEYTFGFEKLKRWIRLCEKKGIRSFEMSHLFTQWGARFTPKIMAWVDGEYKRIFGWDVEALSAEYQAFLRAFLPKLVDFLTREGVMGRCLFHVSDEPEAEHLLRYQEAKRLLLEFIPEEQCIDALANFDFYQKGVVKHPVVSLDHMKPFLEAKADGIWAYYCCGQRKDVANRFLAMPSYRNRVLGWQLYQSRIKGFLQWGFNFWFSAGSEYTINPYEDTSAAEAFPSGDSFLVYPIGEDGEAVPSLRLYVFLEGLQDMRALELLEELTDRAHVLELLKDFSGFDTYPRNRAYYWNLREKINQEIKAL